MKRKIVCIVTILLLCLSLASCDYINIESLAVVVGLGIDKNDDGTYHLSAEIGDPPQDSSKGALESKIAESDGVTIADAMNRLIEHLPGTMYLRHCYLIVVGEKMAREEGFEALIKDAMHMLQFQASTLVAVSKGCSAGDIIKAKLNMKPLISIEIRDELEAASKYSGETMQVEQYSLYDKILTSGTMLIPAISIEYEDDEERATLDGIAVITENKLATYLSKEDSCFCIFALGEQIRGQYTFMDPSDGELLTIKLETGSTKIYTEESDDGLTVKFKLEASGKIIDNDGIKLTYWQDSSEELLSEIEDDLASSIEKTVKKIQNEFSADVFGIAPKVQNSHRKLWSQIGKENWPEYFSKIKIEVSTDLTLGNVSIGIHE